MPTSYGRHPRGNTPSTVGTFFASTSGLTRRRIIEPGTTWSLSRRTTQRYFLLNPDQARHLEQCYWYCLGLAAQRFGVIVHAGCLMSTHSHEVIIDVRVSFLGSFRTPSGADAAANVG